MEWSEISEKFKNVVPRFPTPPIAKLPRPPLLRESERSDLGILLRAWNAACFEWFGTRGVRLENVDGRVEELALKAAEVLFVERIAPLAWCGFSCQVWLTETASKAQKKGYRGRLRRGRRQIVTAEEAQTPPPIRFAFHEERLRRHADCSAFCVERFDVERLLFEPEHVELARRWERMRYALLAAGRLDEAGAKKIVDRFLSKSVLAKLTDRIEAKVEARGREIARDVARGKWIW